MSRGILSRSDNFNKIAIFCKTFVALLFKKKKDKKRERESVVALKINVIETTVGSIPGEGINIYVRKRNNHGVLIGQNN